MGKGRFITRNPAERETVKLELEVVKDDEGNVISRDYILVKKELTNRERRHVETAGFRGLKGAGSEKVEIDIDWEAMEFERVYTWVHNWSFTDANGNLVQYNRENLEQLDAQSFQEIVSLLDKYVAAMEKEKNSPSPAPQRRLKSVGAGSTTGT